MGHIFMLFLFMKIFLLSLLCCVSICFYGVEHFSGANPTLRDNGRGFRADQWARFCGRYVCADVIEKYARQRLLERSTSYGNWGGDHELGARVLMGKVVPVPPMPQQSSNGTYFNNKIRRSFRKI